MADYANAFFPKKKQFEFLNKDKEAKIINVHALIIVVLETACINTSNKRVIDADIRLMTIARFVSGKKTRFSKKRT